MIFEILLYKVVILVNFVLLEMKVFLLIFAFLKGYILVEYIERIQAWLQIVSPRHDPGPEFLQSAVTLPGIIFQVETKV